MFGKNLQINKKQFWQGALSAYLLVCILGFSFSPNMHIFAEGSEDVPTESQPSVENVESEGSELPVELAVEEDTQATQTPVDEIGESIDQNHNDTQDIENSAENEESEALAHVVISSGEANASTDVVNEVNNNEIGSEGAIEAVGSSQGSSNIDSRDLVNNISTTTPHQEDCNSCENSASTTTSISNQNTASVENNVVVEANTGNNNIASSSNSVITTGSAMAGANVVNVVNSNFVNSNYVLLVFNNFGDWDGDLVLPNLDFFNSFLRLFSASGCCSDTTNNNSASVVNNANVMTNSGDNETGSGDISTGNAISSTNLFNSINENVFGQSSFYLFIRVFGDWGGNIFNLPDFIGAEQTNEGVLLYNKNDQDALPYVSNINISNNNNASVTNNIIVSANSGGNNIAGNGNIVSGNAYSGVNIVNIVNTNLISTNWFKVLGNVFGNWNGSISFGQPDLWVGTVASTEGVLDAGSSLQFKTTVKNNGDARASDIWVKVNSNSSFLKYRDNDMDNEYLHFIPSLNPGQSITFDYMGTIDNYLPPGNESISSQALVMAYETDGDRSDNTDVLPLIAGYNSGGPSPVGINNFSSTNPLISVKKTHKFINSVVVDGATSTPVGSNVEYNIVVKNNGGVAYNGVLNDVLTNPLGEVINEQQWGLGEIAPSEQIVVTYTMQFSDDAIIGDYKNEAWVELVGGEVVGDRGLEESIKSNIATDIVVLSPVYEFVLLTDNTQDQQGNAGNEVLHKIGEILGVSDFKIDREEQNEQSVEYLRDFCWYNKETSPLSTLDYSQTALLGFSFVLMIDRSRVKEKDLIA